MINGYEQQIGSATSSELNLATGNSPRKTILMEYGELGESIAVLSKEIEELYSRLQPVLGQDLPSASLNANKESVASSPLSESIRSDVSRVRQLTENVRRLMQRIEL